MLTIGWAAIAASKARAKRSLTFEYCSINRASLRPYRPISLVEPWQQAASRE
jgi:hypothetical protein